VKNLDEVALKQTFIRKNQQIHFQNSVLHRTGIPLRWRGGENSGEFLTGWFLFPIKNLILFEK
jgi:hypothetical protein